jgi:hypothetical protein
MSEPGAYTHSTGKIEHTRFLFCERDRWEKGGIRQLGCQQHSQGIRQRDMILSPVCPSPFSPSQNSATTSGSTSLSTAMISAHSWSLSPAASAPAASPPGLCQPTRPSACARHVRERMQVFQERSKMRRGKGGQGSPGRGGGGRKTGR